VLYEFAMTPDLFDASVANSDGSASIILVELLRGIAENGLLANLHKDRWLRYVTEKRTTTLSPALKDKVLACLKCWIIGIGWFDSEVHGRRSRNRQRMVESGLRLA